MFHVYAWKWITSEYNTCWGPTTSPEDDTVRVALSGVVKRWSPSRCLMASTIESRLCLEEEVVTMYDLKRDSFFFVKWRQNEFFLWFDALCFNPDNGSTHPRDEANVVFLYFHVHTEIISLTVKCWNYPSQLKRLVTLYSVSAPL